jgi:hypothetical protein
VCVCVLHAGAYAPGWECRGSTLVVHIYVCMGIKYMGECASLRDRMVVAWFNSCMYGVAGYYMCVSVCRGWVWMQCT